MKDIFSFSSKEFAEDENLIQLFGMRGRALMDMAALEIPILPGFILTEAFLADEKEKPDVAHSLYDVAFSKMGEILEKSWGAENPLLVKLVVSPMLNMVYTFSSIHNIGLCDATIDSFVKYVGEDFAWHEYKGLFQHIMDLEILVTAKSTRRKTLEDLVKETRKAKTVAQSKSLFSKLKKVYPAEVFEDAYAQFCFVKDLFSQFFAQSETLNDSAILVQAMTFGNYGKQSYFGSCTTRDALTGKDELTGKFFPNAFDATESEGKPINRLAKTNLDLLKVISKQLEKTYKEIRNIKFNVENGKLWIIDQSSVLGVSAMAEINTLLDLLDKKIVDDAYVINAVRPARVSELLHPIFDKSGTSKIPSVTGGISGAMGCAVGQVYFSTSALMDAYNKARQYNLDTRFILAMPATYAEDVKAIELSNGVISQEGGYASHAPVVARSLGKVAMVQPGIKFAKTGMTLDGVTVKEGDLISIEVPSASEPTIYFGELKLVKPNIDKSGLLEFLQVVQGRISGFDVHANADQPRDAELALKFGANGLGLCRTEHMFFDEKRIPVFRSLIIARDIAERKKILTKLKKMQITDFLGLFTAMGEKPVTIRLLDAPLHEFLPRNADSMKEFITFYRKEHPNIKAEEIRILCDMTNESNPMLGHRGVRMGVTYPEIYRMQVEAILEAAYQLKKDKGITCHPEIMIPIVMNPAEIKAMRFGKRIEGAEIIGIHQIEEEIRKKLNANPLPFKVGTMVELPAAALLADELAQHADFFSFGTNDLTQTCLGLSRDDFNSFFTDYNEYDLLGNNPFRYLQDSVKELIKTAVERGRFTRPDLSCGLCGEHGAEPENIHFAMETGLNYVSCSPYGIPVAKLAIAQKNLKQLESE